MKIEPTATASFQACKCTPSNGLGLRSTVRTGVLLPAASIAKVSCKGLAGPIRRAAQPALTIARLLLASSPLFAGCGRSSEDELEAAAAACADASPRTLGEHSYFVALN